LSSRRARSTLFDLFSFLVEREFSNNSLQIRKKIKETVFLTKVHSEECAAMVKIQSTGSSQLSTKDTRVTRGRIEGAIAVARGLFSESLTVPNA
jgi:hypothetical protein